MSLGQLSRPLAKRVGRLRPFTEHVWSTPQSRPSLVTSVEAALDASQTHYTSVAGILPLREQLAMQIGQRYGISISPQDILISCGGAEARFITFRQFAATGSKIYCPGRTDLIENLASFIGASIVREVNDPTEISLAYLSPHDGRKAFDSLMPLIAQHGWHMAWEMNMGRETFHPAQDSSLADRIISIGNLDHALPGWRIGWLISSHNTEALRSLKQIMTICSASLSQWAAAGWLARPYPGEALEERRE